MWVPKANPFYQFAVKYDSLTTSLLASRRDCIIMGGHAENKSLDDILYACGQEK
jgi:hypothetical protein